MSENNRNRGLYGKYQVRRTDGSSDAGGKHEHCDCFVLDLTHDPLALIALEAYATACSYDYPILFDDLNDKLAKLVMHRTCTPLYKRGDGINGQRQECSAPAVIPLGNGCWFCIEHAQDWERRAHPLGPTGKGTLERRLKRISDEKLALAAAEFQEPTK